MEFMDLIQKRQSVRRYADGDVPVGDIEKMIEAARIAPSAKNLQNWHFIAIKNKTLIQKVADATLRANEKIAVKMDAVDPSKADRFRKFAKNFTVFFKDAPLLIVVMSEQYDPSGYHEMRLVGMDADYLIHEKNPGMQSLGAAVEHLYLRAIELGYGVCWLTSANYADDEIEALMKEEAGFDKPGYFMAALLSVGVTEGEPKSPPKKERSAVLTVVE
ncbi:MAG: nitroreductase family protein [Clostridiales Family XIII bacterium]|jgi:nitroreductase|nr:nitroreductase family protein [Clostridiales Family XIII bacterium]